MSCTSIVIIYYFIPGTKNVVKQIKKIAIGTTKNEGRTWFGELSDKRKDVLYACTCTCIIIIHNVLYCREKYKSTFVLLYEKLLRLTN